MNEKKGKKKKHVSGRIRYKATEPRVSTSQPEIEVIINLQVTCGLLGRSCKEGGQIS